MSYFNRLTSAIQKECYIIKERVKHDLVSVATERSHDLIRGMRPALEKLRPESWFLAGYERGVSDVLERLEITDREILRALDRSMENIN